LLSDAIEISPLIILNDSGSPTRLPKSGSPSSPNLSLASAHVALAATWETHVQLNSDHLPITITLPCDDAPPPKAAKTYTNFRKADWPAFIRESEGVFRGLQMPASVGAGEKIFCKVLLTAAKHAIPAGFCKDCKPGLSHEANILINERDTLRAADPTDPAIKILNHNITKIISENKKSIWRDKVIRPPQAVYLTPLNVGHSYVACQARGHTYRRTSILPLVKLPFLIHMTYLGNSSGSMCSIPSLTL
jgi:hypothetical protein